MLLWSDITNPYYEQQLDSRMRSLPFLLIACFALVMAGEADAEKEPEWFYDTGDQVYSVAISADGEYIVAGGNDDKVHLFDKDNSTPLWSYDTGFYSVDEVAISADGEYIAAGSAYYNNMWQGKVYLFDKDNSTPLWNYTSYHRVNSVSISSDGEYIAAGSSGGVVFLFNKDNSTPIWDYSITSSMLIVAISADGEYIAGGSTPWANRVHLFGKDSSAPLWSYETVDYVRTISISADGKYIAVGSDDQFVYLFDKNSSTPLWSYGTEDHVRSVSISADGKYIVATSYDDNVYLFDNNISQNGGDGDGGGSAKEAVCQHGDTKLADDGFNHCICNNGEWLCTDMEYKEKDDEGNVTVTDAEEDEEGIPTLSVITTMAAVAVMALRRRPE